MPPSFVGRMPWRSPGVRPIISRASWPTATMPFASETATTEGSWMTMPLPRTKTSTLAVPRSIPIFIAGQSYRLRRRLESRAALDARPELDELVLDVLVAAFDVDGPLDDGRALGRESGKDEARPRPQVRNVELRPVKRGRSGDAAMVWVQELDPGAHAHELGGVLEAVLEDRLVDAALAVRLGEQHGRGRLEVGREAGIRTGLDRGRAVRAFVEAAPVDGDLSTIDVDPDPDTIEHPEERGERLARGALHAYLAAGHGRRQDEGAGLDAVGRDRVISAAEASDALHLDDVRGAALDAGAHPHEEADEVFHLRFAGRRADRRVALGEDRGQQGVLGAHDGHLREDDVTAAKAPGGLREVVAVAVFDARA